MKLLTHIKAMQDMAARYILPADQPYVDRDGNSSKVALGSDQPVRDQLFANDMIYMLDGPEQRAAQAEAELWANQGYPTEDAYLASCRALHWCTEQLRQAGIEPLDLSKLEVAELLHYPPDDFRFPIQEAFPGDDHRQLYHGWRRYPRAMRATVSLGFMTGCLMTAAVWLLVHSTHITCVPVPSLLSLC